MRKNMKSVKLNVVFNAGDSKRTLRLVDGKIKIGCFMGTYEEAINKVKGKYKGESLVDYLDKIKECFDGVEYSPEDFKKLGREDLEDLINKGLFLDELAKFKNDVEFGHVDESDIRRMAREKVKEVQLAPYNNKLAGNRVLEELRMDLLCAVPCSLVGGAVTDILEGRTPKDFDFTCDYDTETLLERLSYNTDFRFQYNSATSTTFLYRGKYIVQFLNNPASDFLFLNEMNEFNMDSGELTTFHKSLLDTKKLALNVGVLSRGVHSPTIFARRVRHWENKGYTISDVSFGSGIYALEQSYVKTISNNESKES